jgi:hypothetical protein
MPIRRIIAFAVIWVVSLFAVAELVRAQSHRINPLPEPRVVSGADVGFRIEGEQNGAPVGVLVVKINGEWVDVKFGTTKGPNLLR